MLDPKDEEKDPYEDFEYIIEPPPKEEVPVAADADSPVRGTLRKIEEAAASNQGLRANHFVQFAGMICPIVCEEETRVQILHGHTKFWISKDVAGKTLSGRKKETKDQWINIFVNHSQDPKQG